MKKIALLYWGKGGNVERVAQIVYKQFDPETIDFFDVPSFDLENLSNYKLLVLGGSTVGAEKWEDATTDNMWNKFFREIQQKDLSGLKIAAFELGNQVLYPGHFVDGLGIVEAEIAKTNASLIGQWPTEGYVHTSSEGVQNKLFFGLALDEDNESELTPERAKKWVGQLIKEVG